MAVEDRLRWDAFFRSQARAPYPDADPLLLQFTPPASGEMRALDLCGGMGQNGLWLAEQGYVADIMDISRVALNRARTEMTLRNLRNVNLLQVDVDHLRLDPAQYQVLCVFRYLRRALFPMLQQAVVPGGRIVYETYHAGYLTQVPSFNRAFLLERGELARYFARWAILHADESDVSARLVAVRPATG